MSHPLEPLTKEEIEKAAQLFKAHGNGSRDQCLFSSVQLIEPPKHAIKQYEDNNGVLPRRIIRLIGTCGEEFGNGGFSADIDITNDDVIRVASLPDDGQAAHNSAELELAYELVLAHPACREAIYKRGITDSDLDNGYLEIDPWPGGGFVHPSIPKGHRSMRVFFYYRKEPLKENMYARPVPNLIIHVDITEKKVAFIEDRGVAPVPSSTPQDQYGSIEETSHQENTKKWALKPLEIIQPYGRSFTVNGHHIEWALWDLRISMHPNHGLVLHQVNYDKRSILFRAALADMVVPYGDPHPMSYWKHVIDAGEYVIGSVVNSLELGCDCVGDIKYFDTNYINTDGSVSVVKNGICMHEEDFGVGWKHTKVNPNVPGEKKSFSRRMRRLVISSFFTVDNYDYGFFWYLYLDGVIEVEVKLTGIVNTNAVDDVTTNDAGHSPLVTPSIAASVHQHLFNFRLHWDLDGGTCSLYEDQVESVPKGEANPHGNLFRNISRLLQTEEEAKRVIKPENSRVWKIVNPSKKNAVGKPVAYKVLYGPAQRHFAQSDSVVVKRSEFALYHVWATPFHPKEMSATGSNPVMSEGPVGLPQYTSTNRNIVDCDLVTWHTAGVTHVPRTEDWPVMPTEYCKLSFVPCGFFDRNPIIDLPAAETGTNCNCKSKL